ncbi:hypothetical protein [Bacillus horti]|uniref:Intracellular proteinase inhibitor BsuPI domain-containing protein n=1 Tax=Caldalkalibacillus horti TaxID=77523 RepID=A0ABT9VWH2_9BACI|nr:hypothetical protein [Bacillus horti]MDQ0164970.1 hypothetical protein [Bacillus horti]
MKKVISIMIIAFLLTGCGVVNTNQEDENIDTSGTIQNENEQSPAQDESQIIESKEIIFSIEGVKLLADEKSDDVYKGITVQTEATSKTFPWYTVTNETYSPVVKKADVNEDGTEEIVVILTIGTGTGAHVQEIHVLHQEDLSEIPVEDPVAYLQQHVESSITHEVDGRVTVNVKWDDQEISMTFDESDVGVWNEFVSFGQIIRYDATDNKLRAELPGAVSPALFAVTATVEYDEKLEVSTITLTEIID